MSVRFPHYAFEVVSRTPTMPGGITVPVAQSNAAEHVSAATDRFERTTAPVTSPINISQPVIYPLKFIDKYVNVDVVQNALNNNPVISKILREHGVTPTISEKNIDKSLKRHLFTTYLYAMEIAKQSRLDRNTTAKLAQACLVHDIGKALIPESIIQKPGKLTSEEREIINLHSRLGAEILKTTDIDPDVIDAVRLHHEHKDNEKKSTNVISKVLSVADVYSALKEERPYKDPMPDEKAFEIMFGMPHLAQNFVKDLSQHRYMSKVF